MEVKPSANVTSLHLGAGELVYVLLYAFPENSSTRVIEIDIKIIFLNRIFIIKGLG